MHRIHILVLISLLFACEESKPVPDRDFRQDMRDFVARIRATADMQDPHFILIPQNGQELLSLSGDSDGEPATAYLSAIDGVGREDLFYGYDGDDEETPNGEMTYMRDFLFFAEENGVQVLTTDYCSTHSKMDDSYARNALAGFISFAAPSRELDVIPDYPVHPFHENGEDILQLDSARNFLYLLNPAQFGSRSQYLGALQATNYDLLIIDLFDQDASPLTAEEVSALKTKANGGDRLVIAYMSIGEAEDYRFYWQDDWTRNHPAWVQAENPAWAGNYKVRYWESDWQSIIVDGPDSYLHRLLDSGFDGAYLDIIDAFEYFEDLRN